jgi:hypothetical protein
VNPVIRATIVLAGLLVLLVAVDVGVRFVGQAPPTELPRLAPVELVAVRRVAITREDERVVLERIGDSGTWRLVSPVEGPADSNAVRELVGRLRKGVPMQVRVEQGDLEKYGLQTGSAARLQVYNDADDAVVDLYVGADTVGGASFVRFPDDDVVYRAQVGGRHRLDRAPRDWRDPTVFAFEPDAASGLALDFGAEGGLRFTKVEGRWQLVGVPDFAVDQVSVRDALQRLGSLRAGRVLPADFPLDGSPMMTATVLREGLDPVGMAFYVQGDLAYVRRTGREEVFQIAANIPKRFAVPLPGWVDRQLIEVDRASIFRMTYHDSQQGASILEQDAADSRWRMIEPDNVDANLRESMQAAIALAGLRADGIADIAPAEAGFPSQNWIELELQDGSKHRVELGARVPAEDSQTPLLFVRTPDKPDRIGVIQLRTLLQLRLAWAR